MLKKKKKNHEKIRETLFTFKPQTTKLLSFWRYFSQKIQIFIWRHLAAILGSFGTRVDLSLLWTCKNHFCLIFLWSRNPKSYLWLEGEGYNTPKKDFCLTNEISVSNLNWSLGCTRIFAVWNLQGSACYSFDTLDWHLSCLSHRHKKG